MADNPRLIFGASCNKAIYQHIIRHRLRSSECVWKGIDQLKAKMYLVRADGSSWGAAFDQVALPRLANALKSRHRILVKVGAASEGDAPWAPWVDGLLHPDWSGIAAHISQDVGEALLENLPQRQDAPQQPQQQQQQKQQKQQQPERRASHHDVSTVIPPSAIVEPSVLLGPDDSVSVAGARLRHDRHRLRRADTRSIGEIQDDLVFGARRLFECTKQINRLQFDRPPPPPPQQYSQPRPRPIQDGDVATAAGVDTDGHKGYDDSDGSWRHAVILARVSRWRLVKRLISLERELDRAWRNTLLGPAVNDVMPPSSLLGGIWLHFLGAGEERLLLRSAADTNRHDDGGLGLDVESIAALAVDDNGFDIIVEDEYD
ncbi:uncharacterized protein GLRG_11221 [Colletotrichum graminicola M1.001]|uniref:Uncharacterized protein n=1 Tax=Colletotrichum graminicola (strain M1.001 / M2 / FGSC 10212) TaxID=645133 RepID=E3QYY9_COLGM|nr:uncharacterized protein GLRG_11221 [Colletotrichum graminicola M1.001]EFQ36077.1 hypothetical protein GLRG_11221 [Colletotrichum graminicola M1.001]